MKDVTCTISETDLKKKKKGMHVALGSLKGVTWPQKPCFAGFKVLSSRRDMQKMLIILDSEGACACQFPPKCMDCIVPTRWSWEKYGIGNQLLVVFSFISALILYDLRQVTSSPSPLIYLAGASCCSGQSEQL